MIITITGLKIDCEVLVSYATFENFERYDYYL